jgi:sec-independent protein translocase protein TatC
MRKFLAAFWRTITAPFRFIFWLLRLIFGWISDILRDFAALFKKDEEEEDSPIIDALGKALENPASVFDHLNALRKHLFRATLFLLLTSALSFAFAERILDFLAQPINGLERLQAIDVTESIGVYMRVSFLVGFTLALPYIVFELLLFAAPGLTRRERFTGMFSIPLIAALFMGGMAFTFFIILQPALTFLLNFIFQTVPRPDSYYSFVLGLMFWMGIAFEFPLAIYVIVAMGFIRAEVLLKQARFAVVILALLAAAITPTIDIFNMLLVWAPLVGLYFIGVGLAFLAQRGRDRRLSRK